MCVNAVSCDFHTKDFIIMLRFPLIYGFIVLSYRTGAPCWDGSRFLLFSRRVLFVLYVHDSIGRQTEMQRTLLVLIVGVISCHKVGIFVDGSCSEH